ncbi:MAG: SDR family NAD(P)-dependent oxidoreductase [Kouleothrix sp.]
MLANAGAHFAREAERAYTLDPRAPEDYHALLAELRAAEWQPHTIVHLWSLGDAGPAELDEAALDRGLDRGFYSLLWLAQALDRHMAGAALELVAVSGGLHAVGADERPRAEQAPLLGALKVIPQEYPHLRCRNVDVLPPNSPARLADQLLAELAAGAAEPVVAYRGAHRWAQRFEPIRIDDDAEGRPLLRERGVYLITGGLGGLGLALAEELARAVRARLVLLGRTGLPERAAWDGWLASHAGDDPTSASIGRARAIEALGAEVLPLRADVTDPAQLHAAVAAAETRFGAIHGVIHAAGVPGGGMIQLKTRAAAERVLAPKLRGALAIEAAFRERSPDFIVLCSSLAAILGGVGQADYCAANGFLDALAQAAWQRGAPIRSINWDRWRNTGMATIAEALHRRHTGADLADGLTAEQGVAAFRRALAERAAPQVAVSTYDLPALLEQQSAYNASSVLDTLEQAQGARPAHPRPQLGSAYAEPRTDAERAIAAIWESLLGFAPIGIHDDFFELGGHSLLATRVIARVREALETELPVRALFDSPTIAGLAQAIGQAQAQPEPGGTIGRATDEDTEQLLASLDQLSEASVDALLAALLAEEGQHP